MAFWRSYAHLVWATKNRQPFIRDDIEKQLYAQIVSKAAEMGCYVYAVNGMEEHTHVVLSTPPKHSVSEIVKMLKGASAHFVNHILRPTEYHFEWQRGYGCFSIGQSQLAQAIAYVQHQKEHHGSQATNAWLERSSELDEGPLQDSPSGETQSSLREETVGYDVFGGFAVLMYAMMAQSLDSAAVSAGWAAQTCTKRTD